MTLGIEWVVLTVGSRPTEFARAIDSISGQTDVAQCHAVVVANGVELGDPLSGEGLRVALAENVGIPAGRNRGVEACSTEIIGLLDDDATIEPDVSARLLAAFAGDPRLGAVALRLNDEQGETTRRHVPRPGGGSAEVSGGVVYFVGAAHAVRAEAFHDVGGYFEDLWYGHEEIEFCWRLIDRGWKVKYLADAVAFHPRTTIARHADGWRLTGRNRVRIARRTLPWPVALLHVSVWLVLGILRAPRGCRRPYVDGWLKGWRDEVRHEPIRWSTVWRLSRLGRPPVI